MKTGKLSLAADLSFRLFVAFNFLPETVLFQIAMQREATEGPEAATRQIHLNQVYALAIIAPIARSCLPRRQPGRRPTASAWAAMGMPAFRMPRDTALLWTGQVSTSIHGSLQCSDCHATIKEYPHPDKVTPVKCETCHAGRGGRPGWQRARLARRASLHQLPRRRARDLPEIGPEVGGLSAERSANLRRLPWQRRDGHEAWPHNVYPLYLDSIHGFALSKEGLLVAANCQSCHGSHHILSHKDPQSPTYKANVPNTCGNCHAGITADYMGGVHGKAILAGKKDAPVCSDCHTAHAIEQPTASAFRMQSTPICGNCHKDKFSTYRDTFHSQLGSLGGYVETARCWDCHGAHEILPASDPHSPINPANLVQTCGRCHAGANASFVQYQPHANARNRKLNPALYYIRLFMNLLLASVLTFFLIHTILWLIRSRYDQVKRRSAEGGKNA